MILLSLRMSICNKTILYLLLPSALPQLEYIQNIFSNFQFMIPEFNYKMLSNNEVTN